MHSYARATGDLAHRGGKKGMTRFQRTALAVMTAASLAGPIVLAGAAPALASYGNSAVYQVEISANGVGASQGGGVWLWIELASNGTGDYTGSDCGREGPGAAGAAPDSGDVTWSSSNGWLTINGVVLNGLGGLPVTIKVSSSLSHYKTTIFNVLGVPFPGWAQVTVAP
jgi:hypothetical protein